MFNLVDQVRQYARDLAKQLVKEGAEEAQWSSLKLRATAVEEESENESFVPGSVPCFNMLERVFQQRGLPRARLPFNPEQASQFLYVWC